MVVFTCNYCGDSLQKPKVEKHYQMVCRRMKSLTCVDCFKDFKAEEYVVHIKCITEEERYAAKGSFGKPVIKKGEAKQESWTEMIKSILDKETNLQHSHKNLLQTISSYTNVPRKKQKFLNFIKSASGGKANMKDVEGVWNIIEKYKAQFSKPADEVNGKSKESKGSTDEVNGKEDNLENKMNGANGNLKEDKNKENKNKRKAEPVDEVVTKKKTKTKLEDNQEDNLDKFSYKGKIIEILTAKTTMSLKKLQKKVLNAYMKEMGVTECTEKQINKFNKKLKKINSIEIVDDHVKLIEQ